MLIGGWATAMLPHLPIGTPGTLEHSSICSSGLFCSVDYFNAIFEKCLMF